MNGEKSLYFKMVLSYSLSLSAFTIVSFISAAPYNFRPPEASAAIWEIISILCSFVLFYGIYLISKKINIEKFVTLGQAAGRAIYVKYPAIFFGAYLFLIIIGGIPIIYLIEFILRGYEIPDMLYGTSSIICGAWGYQTLTYENKKRNL